MPLHSLQTKLYSRGEIDSELWDRFIARSPQGIIYATTGYLDCVCPGWSAIICKNGDEWLGVMPLNIARKFFQNYSLKPPFTQYLGIFFKEINEKMHRLVHMKKIIIESIIHAIPKNLKLFNHNFSPEFDYFVPFHWNQFEIRPLHSYHLSLQNPLHEIYDNFSHSVTTRIIRAEKLDLKCVEGNSVNNLVEIMVTRKIISANDGIIFQKLWKYITSVSTGFTIYITDPLTNQIYCGWSFRVYFDRVILLASALDFRFKKSGAHTLLVWKAIQKAHQISGIKIFDFEGSMIRSIENYKRSFGATPVAYYNISHNNLPLPYSFGLNLKNSFQKNRKAGSLKKKLVAC